MRKMLIVKRTLLTGAWLYGGHRTCAKTVAVPCGTSQLNSTVTTLVDIQNVLCKATVMRSELHTTRALTEHSVSLEVENRAIVAIVKRLGLRDEALSKCSYMFEHRRLTLGKKILLLGLEPRLEPRPIDHKSGALPWTSAH